MANESNFELDFVVKYFIDDLGYESREPSIFNSDLLLNKSDVKSFIETNNNSLCKKLIKDKYQSKRDDFWNDFYKALSDYLYSKNNVAIYLNPRGKNTFKFQGEQFVIFVPFENEMDNVNQFVVMRQPAFKFKGTGDQLTVIPDVGLFINGMMFSFIQLKLTAKGQGAKDEGRGQVLEDYLKTVNRIVWPDIDRLGELASDKEKSQLISKHLKPFHSMIHICSEDERGAYVLRGIQKFYNGAENLAKNNIADDKPLKKEMLEQFFPDSVYVKEGALDNVDKAHKFLKNTYSKASIQKEILYYNFLQTEATAQHANGTKKIVLKNYNTTLSFPRPNQKYGVDKTVAEVVEKYKHENDKNYELSKLEAKLTNQNIPLEVKNRALEKRKSYRNNQNLYSILLQYAAGFGKTYIICWLAMMFKDLLTGVDKNSPHLFDKILLISDRVDLRDQVDMSMRNMNIDPSLFLEAQSSEELRSALKDTKTRIIIVNIQKFPFLTKMMGDTEKQLLANKRIAFLIDEIHRSNSGDQHKSMTNLFDEVADNFGFDNQDKKNLVVGLTATPTDEVLARFGEYQGCLEDIKWTPFDSYTMDEAVTDGFVLNPTKNKVAYAIELHYDLIEEGDKMRFPTTQEIYEFDDRIKIIAAHVVKTLLEVTYTNIWKQAKGMLACYSITAANKYFDAITAELKKASKDAKYAGRNLGKVYMVYSSTQDNTPAYRKCSDNKVTYNSEKEVINAFRKDNNGIIIVVDKLQTGFDEPKLHTLFLDKEVTGIACVQTVCRINRTTKHKKDCLVVDYSHGNKNIANITTAFEKYGGIVVSEFNSLDTKDQVAKLYKDIIETSYYKNFFPAFVVGDIKAQMVRQNYLDKRALVPEGRELMVRDLSLFSGYLRSVEIIKNLVALDPKFTEDLFINFLKEYIKMCREIIKSNPQVFPVLDYWVENHGVIEGDGTIIEDPEEKSGAKKTGKEEQSTGYATLDHIIAKNEEEEKKQELIDNFLGKIGLLFKSLVEIDNTKNNGRTLIKLQNPLNHSEEEVRIDFELLFSMTLRRVKKEEGMKQFVKDIEEIAILIQDDFVEHLNLKNKGIIMTKKENIHSYGILDKNKPNIVKSEVIMEKEIKAFIQIYEQNKKTPARVKVIETDLDIDNL